MFQKTEITLKLHSEIVEKYNKASEKAEEITENEDFTNQKDRKEERLVNGIYIEGEKAYEYFHSTVTDEECKLVEELEEVKKFCKEHITCYIDLVKLISDFTWEKNEFGKIVEIKVNEAEENDELKIVIEENWSEDFKEKCINRLNDDGFGTWVDYDYVPNAFRKLMNEVEFGEYLYKKYAENSGKISKYLTYNIITYYGDDDMTDEGAVGVFDHEKNEYVIYGYGEITDNVVSREYLEKNPDKLWHTVNTRPWWRPLIITDEDFDLWCSDTEKCDYDLFGCVDYDPYLEFNFSDDTESNSQWYGCWGRETITSRELLAMIDQINNSNKLFLQAQKNTCERNNMDYSVYANESIIFQLLLFSDDYDVLYLENDITDENGITTGELSIHCKNFKA